MAILLKQLYIIHNAFGWGRIWLPNFALVSLKIWSPFCYYYAFILIINIFMCYAYKQSKVAQKLWFSYLYFFFFSRRSNRLTEGRLEAKCRQRPAQPTATTNRLSAEPMGSMGDSDPCLVGSLTFSCTNHFDCPPYSPPGNAVNLNAPCRRNAL